MNDFTASNGQSVRVEHANRVLLLTEQDENMLSEDYLHGNDFLDSGNMQALREFFQAEADERLGRWRWPENPDYVVYPCSVKTRVRVLRESGTGDLEWVDQGDGRSYEFVHAARAYFDAHPEPKPWHDAKPGEVWVLETRSDLGTDKRAWHITDRPESFWSLGQGYLLVKSTAIISGHRIWPEAVAS